MIGRRTTIGLSLLCALVFCAFAAPNASATGTTAFTCVEGGGEKDFTDAHCDNQVKAGEGKFGHVAIELGSTTEITVSNEKTAAGTTAAEPFILTGKVAGLSLEIVCSTVSGTGTLTNEVEGANMQTTGNALVTASACTIPNQPKCAVKGGAITWDAHFKTFQNETAMGIELTPRTGISFGSWTLTNNGTEKCAVTGTFAIEGSCQATPGGTAQGKGATLTITESTSKNLKWGGNPYTLTGKLTLSKKGGNPITFTT